MLDPTVRSPTLSDYGALVRRQWWIVLLGALLGVLGAAAYTSTQPQIYTSTTQVLVTPTGVEDAVVLANGRTRAEINLDTEAQLLTSTAVVARVGELLRTDAAPDELVDRVRVTVPANTEVLTIAFTADTAVAAQDGADAFAMAYLANRAETARDPTEARLESLRAQLLTLNASLSQVTASLTTLTPDSAERAAAEAQVQSLAAQIAILTAEVDGLDSTPVTPGRTITDATLPSRPSSPVLLINLVGGAMLGLLLGCGVALLRQRSDRHLRGPDEVTRLTGLPVLVSIAESSSTQLAQATSAAGRGYVRLRNVLTAPLSPDARVILVAGADAGADGSEVADNLAATLARTGAEVVLVSTNAGGATVQRLGLARRWAGLSEVLVGEASASAALQVAAGLETLRVLTPGRNPDRAADLLETDAARELLSTLRRAARYIIVQAPPTAASGQAQTLAAFADTALLVIRTRTTNADDVNDAVVQFQAMRTPVIGSVLVPPDRRRGSRLGRRARSRTRQGDSSPQAGRSRQATAHQRVEAPAGSDGRTDRGSVSRSPR